MLDDSRKVPMPDKKVVIRRQKEKEYVYYCLRAYRNEKGQPTNDTVLIGRRDLESGLLIPNKRYFSIYSDTQEPANPGNVTEDGVQRILDYGNHFLLNYILEKYTVLDTLAYAFPKIYRELAVLAEYMVCEGNVFYYCEDWCDKTYTGLHKSLSSQDTSEICRETGREGRQKFFKRWIYAREKEEYLAYDVTSISSYSSQNDLIEWGYNRDKEELPQLNMGMAFGETSQIPVFYNVYPGSIPDKSYLDFMLRDSRELGIHYSKLVMDRGFFTEKNVQELAEKTLRFIVSIPPSQKIPRELIHKNAGMQYDSSASLGPGLPYARKKEITDYGFRANVHIYYDTMKFHLESETLYSGIEKREETLKGRSRMPSGKSSYDKYFNIKEGKTGLQVERNHEEIDRSLSNLGYFLILTTDFKMTPKEVLETYRRKDVVEKCFDNLKNSLDMKRVRSHGREIGNGKIFICFIGLILESILENVLGETMKREHMTKEKIIKEMSKIRVVELKEGSYLLNPITKKQRLILEAFGLTVEDVWNSLRKR